MMLAQSTDLTAVPETTLKWVLVILISVALIAAYLWSAFRRDNTVRIDDAPPPQFQKADKRYNHEATEGRFVRVESRLRDHDRKFESIEQERRLDEEKASKRNNRVMFALGKIAQKLDVDIEPAD